MRAILTKLDNGYTLTISEEEVIPNPDAAGNIVREKKQRLVFENKEAALAKITEVM